MSSRLSKADADREAADEREFEKLLLTAPSLTREKKPKRRTRRKPSPITVTSLHDSSKKVVAPSKSGAMPKSSRPTRVPRVPSRSQIEKAPTEHLFDDLQEDLDTLGFKTYSDYLSSHYWRLARERYRNDKRARKSCYVCGDLKYQLHHRTYRRLGRERPIIDLLPLCSGCHKGVHEHMQERRSEGLDPDLWGSVRNYKEAQHTRPTFGSIQDLEDVVDRAVRPARHKPPSATGLTA